MNAGHAKSAADSLHAGFVVLARRPNPPHGYSYEPVSAVFPEYPNGLEQAQNVLESRQAHEKRGVAIWHDMIPVEYVIGEIKLEA